MSYVPNGVPPLHAVRTSGIHLSNSQLTCLKEKKIYIYEFLATYDKVRGPTPEWGGWTVTGSSPAEGCFLMAGVFDSG